MFEPVKAGLGRYLGRWFDSLVPTTPSMQRYRIRPLGQAILWAPGRMVDAATDMVASYQRNATDGGDATRPYQMPVTLVAVAKDYEPARRGYTRQITDFTPIILDQDPLQRLFKVRTIAGELRAQIVVAAHDEPTARSLAAQWGLWVDTHRRFSAAFPFAGFDHEYPVQIETPETPASVVASDVSNLTILALDMTLLCTVPLFSSPLPGEPNDGRGSDDDPNNPHGFPNDVSITF